MLTSVLFETSAYFRLAIKSANESPIGFAYCLSSDIGIFNYFCRFYLNLLLKSDFKVSLLILSFS